MVRAQMEITKCPFGYLFVTEIELLSADCGFENLEAVEWLVSNRWGTLGTGQAMSQYVQSALSNEAQTDRS